MTLDTSLTAGATHVNGHTPHAEGATERLQIIDDEKQFTYEFIFSNVFVKVLHANAHTHSLRSLVHTSAARFNVGVSGM